MSAGEKAWVDGALAASDYVMERRLHLPRAPYPTIVLFNDHCRFESPAGPRVRWAGTPHNGKIRLGDQTIDAGIVSFTGNDDKSGQTFFVMALPSVWEAAKAAKPGDNGLQAVFLHEFSHTRQAPVLKRYFDAAAKIYPVPDDLSDDSVQARFKSDPAYVAAFEEESNLLYRAAAEPDSSKACGFARQALALMEARQKRWFTGADAMWTAYDDIFLTMEGFGQWNAYAWLADPKGGAMSPAAALKKMRGSTWWSQDEGLALFLVIDRFVPGWAAQAFASPPKLGIDLLREAVGRPAAKPAS